MTDFNDELDAAGAPPDPERDGVIFLPLSSIRSKTVKWLWPGWLARGKLHVLAGAPGTGKTTLSLALAATLTSGGRWPDGSRATAGRVLMWSGEDDAGDTIAPRLRAAGADESRFVLIAGRTRNGKRQAFDPAHDLPALAVAAARLGDVAMLIVDPLVAALGDADSHRNAETRNALAPLVELGQQFDAAVIGITHHSKGTAGRDPVERVTGSIAFGALARIVLSAAKREEVEPGQASRMLVRSKSNIGPDGGGFGYDLVMRTGDDGIAASTVTWGAEIEGSARALLAVADAQGEGPGRPDNERQESIDWLRDALASAPKPAKEIKSESRAAGLSWATVRRAKDDLRVISYRESTGNTGGGTWMWRLPVSQGAHNPIHRNCEHLANHHQATEKKGEILSQDAHDLQGAHYSEEENVEHLAPVYQPTGREKGAI